MGPPAFAERKGKGGGLAVPEPAHRQLGCHGSAHPTAGAMYTGSRIEPPAPSVSARRRNFCEALWIENRTRSKFGLRQSTQTFIPRGLTEPDFRSSSIFDPESVHKIPKSH